MTFGEGRGTLLFAIHTNEISEELFEIHLFRTKMTVGKPSFFTKILYL